MLAAFQSASARSDSASGCAGRSKTVALCAGAELKATQRIAATNGRERCRAKAH